MNYMRRRDASLLVCKLRTVVKGFDLSAEVGKFIRSYMCHAEELRGLFSNVLFNLLIYLVLEKITYSLSVCLYVCLSVFCNPHFISMISICKVQLGVDTLVNLELNKSVKCF